MDLVRLLGLLEVEAPRISRQAAHESGKVVSPTQEIFLAIISVRGRVDPRAIVRSEGFYVTEKLLPMLNCKSIETESFVFQVAIQKFKDQDI